MIEPPNPFLIIFFTLIIANKPKQDLQTETEFLQKHSIVLQSRSCFTKKEVVKTIIFICCHSISLTEQPKQ